MSDLPPTIKHPGSFNKSQWSITCPYCHRVVGFDGVFDWGWVIESIRRVNPETTIMPMDFDGVVERFQHYLIFETKDVGKDISQGQLITLQNLIIPKSFTVMSIEGKTCPEHWWTMGRVKENGDGLRSAQDYVERWFRWANGQSNVSHG